MLNLVVIRAADPGRAVLFYQRIGLRFERHRHDTGPEHYACELGPLTFEIYPHTRAADATPAARIGFRVPSVDAAIAGLLEIGVAVVSPPKDSPWGRRAVVDDFDGHRVELTEAVDD